MADSTGFLHPGAMGSTVAAACSGQRWWASETRSTATHERAEHAGLRDAVTLDALVERVDVLVSICPPSSALDVARSISARGFEGTYVDANAVSPALTIEMSALFDDFVDGGIIGPPATTPGTTRMYLSGRGAAAVAQRWSGSALDVRLLDETIGSASALKMAYAAWTKGRSALLLAVSALAEVHDVSDALQAEWEISQPGLAAIATATARQVAPKAWRFEGEMHQIAETFESVGLPGDFHRGAAEIYRRLADLQHGDAHDLDRVITELVGGPHVPGSD